MFHDFFLGFFLHVLAVSRISYILLDFVSTSLCSMMLQWYLIHPEQTVVIWYATGGMFVD